MRRAARLTLAALLLALGACSGPDLTRLTLKATVGGWPAGRTATLAAVATPGAASELELASTEVTAAGTFLLNVPPPAPALLRPAGDIYPEAPECAASRVDNPTAGLLFIARYPLTDRAGSEIGVVSAGETLAGGRSRSLLYLYAGAATAVKQNCTFGDKTFDIDLTLHPGWNSLLLEAPPQAGSGLYRVTSGPVPGTVSWRYYAAGSTAAALLERLERRLTTGER